MALLHQLHAFLSRQAHEYAVCGGHAIDLFVGRKTRPHKDLDVAAYWADRDDWVMFMLMEGWDLYEPCGCAYLHRILNAADQRQVKSNIWCVKRGNPHYAWADRGEGMYEVAFDNAEQTALDFIELLFNRREDGHFLYARDMRITRPLSLAIRQAGSLPYMAPELALLYKSTAHHQPEYRADFMHALPLMNDEQRKWLADALRKAYTGGHPWLEERGML